MRPLSSPGFVGPPDPVSNLRKYKYELPVNATPLEKRLFEERERVHKWNDDFWRNHNTEFIKQREEFVKKGLKLKKGEDSNLNADEMSVFYKRFLDNNWKRHVVYNFTWYGKNFNLTLMQLKVKLAKLFKRRNE